MPGQTSSIPSLPLVVNGLYERIPYGPDDLPVLNSYRPRSYSEIEPHSTRVLVLSIGKNGDGVEYITKFLDEEGVVHHHDKWEYGWRLPDYEWRRVQ